MTTNNLHFARDMFLIFLIYVIMLSALVYHYIKTPPAEDKSVSKDGEATMGNLNVSKQEAIEILQYEKRLCSYKTREAMEIAIEALKESIAREDDGK